MNTEHLQQKNYQRNLKEAMLLRCYIEWKLLFTSFASISDIEIEDDQKAHTSTKLGRKSCI